MARTALVTGATGTIGGALVPALLDAGWVKATRGEDARQRVISLTASGSKRIARDLPF